MLIEEQVENGVDTMKSLRKQKEMKLSEAKKEEAAA